MSSEMAFGGPWTRFSGFSGTGGWDEVGDKNVEETFLFYASVVVAEHTGGAAWDGFLMADVAG
jgi:uncharacterized MAPEG superfamily protein